MQNRAVRPQPPDGPELPVWQLPPEAMLGAGTADEMLILVGDNPERIHSEAAFAKLCGACPIPASSGKTSRHRLNRGGHRQANAALYRVVIVRMRAHQPTIDYVRRRTAEGKTKLEIIRCLKRFVAREVFGYLCRNRAADCQSTPGAPFAERSGYDQGEADDRHGRIRALPAGEGDQRTPGNIDRRTDEESGGAA